MRVLVTGGAGFIGRHTVRLLLGAGHEVLVVDNLSTGKAENVPPGASLEVLDILDGLELERAATAFSPHSVLHLAARVSIRASLDGFSDDGMQNFIGTNRVLEAALKARARRFIMAGSMAVYADAPSPDPIPESWPLEPISPYGISKLAGEKLVHLIGRQAGMETLCLRFFNTFGPGQANTPYVGVITIFINRIRAGEVPLIFGDGEQCRDFIYVGDVARACVMALESDSSGFCLNIGTGRKTTVNQIAELLLERMKSELRPQYLPAHPGELRNSIADTTLASRVLGFSARCGIKDMIDEVIGSIPARTVPLK